MQAQATPTAPANQRAPYKEARHANGLYKGMYRVKMFITHMDGTSNSAMGVYPWYRESQRYNKFLSAYKQIYNYKGNTIREVFFYDWGNMQELIGTYDGETKRFSGDLPQAHHGL